MSPPIHPSTSFVLPALDRPPSLPPGILVCASLCENLLRMTLGRTYQPDHGITACQVMLKWCPGAESNHRHEDFQSTVAGLEPELSRDRLRQNKTPWDSQSIDLMENLLVAHAIDWGPSSLHSSHTDPVQRTFFVIPVKSQSNQLPHIKRSHRLPVCQETAGVRP
jgi:hypothetical protein